MIPVPARDSIQRLDALIQPTVNDWRAVLTWHDALLRRGFQSWAGRVVAARGHQCMLFTGTGVDLAALGLVPGEAWFPEPGQPPRWLRLSDGRPVALSTNERRKAGMRRAVVGTDGNEIQAED